MDSQSRSQKFQLVLPTQKLPPALKHITQTPTPQFLVGYRNILVKREQGYEWALVKNNHFCGRAYIFEIGQNQANQIQDIKQQDEEIEIASNSYILLKKADTLTQSTQQLKVEELKEMLSAIGGVDKINLNLVQNAYNSFTDYKLNALNAVEALKWEQKQQELTVQQQVQLQFNAKQLAGSCLLAVPMISKDTGKKVKGELLPLNMVTH